MDSESEAEDSTLSELDIVKGQLQTYHLLNADLSKKVQEFKIAVNAANKELVRTRNELMAEKLKSSELRRALNIMNSQCTDFFNAYMLNLQKCIERTDLEIAMPGDLQRDRNRPSTSTGQGAIQFRPVRIHQLPNDNEQPNILNTIIEESATDTRFQVDDPIVASTPLAQTVLRCIQNLQSPEEEAETSTDPTPKRPSSSLGGRASSGVRRSMQKALNETSSEDELDMVENSRVVSKSKNISQRRNSTRRQNITVDLSQDSETLIDEDSTTNISAGDLSISQYPVKEVTVNVTLLKPRNSIVDRYTEAFTAVEKEPEQNISVEVNDELEHHKENEREMSVDSTLSSATFASSSTTTSSLLGVSRKRKAASDIPRRSTGRPKRKARMVIATLAEVPLNRKLRRSK